MYNFIYILCIQCTRTSTLTFHKSRQHCLSITVRLSLDCSVAVSVTAWPRNLRPLASVGSHPLVYV